MSNKEYTAAVIIQPPEDLWEPIQYMRRQYDKAYVRWMPHVSLYVQTNFIYSKYLVFFILD